MKWLPLTKDGIIWAKTDESNWLKHIEYTNIEYTKSAVYHDGEKERKREDTIGSNYSTNILLGELEIKRKALSFCLALSMNCISRKLVLVDKWSSSLSKNSSKYIF